VIASGLDAALAGELAIKLGEAKGGRKFALFLRSLKKRRGQRDHGRAEIESWRIATRYRRLAEEGLIKHRFFLDPGVRCIDGRLWRHRPRADNPHFEEDAGPCPLGDAKEEDLDAADRAELGRRARLRIQEAFRDGLNGPHLSIIEKRTGPTAFPEIAAFDLVEELRALAQVEFADREPIPSHCDRDAARCGHEYDEAPVAHVIDYLATRRCAQIATEALRNVGWERTRKFPGRARHELVKPR
jgi:hypothetical protein